MSAKFKFFLIFSLSSFATAVVAGIYRIKQWHSTSYTAEEQQHIQAKQISSQTLVTTSSRRKYKSIPLTRFRTLLRGTDPATLAINAFYTTESKGSNRKVEVIYPQPNQAMVTITQTNLASPEPQPIKYRVELTSFGRSLFVTSPPLWQIVWAGSSEECLRGATDTLTSTTCQ